MDIIQKILGNERYKVVMKDKVNFKNPNTYLKTVTSFANGKCIGYIIFGIEPENKEIIGIKNVKKAYKEIFKEIKTKIFPDLIPIIEIININARNIVLLKIFPGKNIRYYYLNTKRKSLYKKKRYIENSNKK